MVATSRRERMRSLNTRMGMPRTSSVTTSNGPPGPVSCSWTSALVGTIRTLLLRPRGNDFSVSLSQPPEGGAPNGKGRLRARRRFRGLGVQGPLRPHPSGGPRRDRHRDGSRQGGQGQEGQGDLHGGG